MEYNVFCDLTVVVADFVGKYLGGVMNCIYTILYIFLELWGVISVKIHNSAPVSDYAIVSVK